MDQRKCDKHAGGHCWHQNGSMSYRGRSEEACPVVCCHCKSTAVRVEYNPQSYIEHFVAAVSASEESK